MVRSAFSAARRHRAKLGLKRDVPPPDPAGEHVDSSLMTHRLRDGDQLSARVDGGFGVYRTTVRLGDRLDGECTCPSDIQPCKHVRALRATWERNPDSFFDVRAFMQSLDGYDKAQLIQAIDRIIALFPQALGAFDVPGFAAQDAEGDE